jgi:hypothetical protein
MEFPLQRMVLDITADAVQFRFIANDVFIIALPWPVIKRRPVLTPRMYSTLHNDLNAPISHHRDGSHYPQRDLLL